MEIIKTYIQFTAENLIRVLWPSREQEVEPSLAELQKQVNGVRITRERDWEQQPFLIPSPELQSYRETLHTVICREHQEAARGTEECHSDWGRLRAWERHIALSKEDRWEEDNETKVWECG